MIMKNKLACKIFSKKYISSHRIEMHYEIFLHENKSAADFLLSILAHVTDDKNIEY